MKWVDVEGAQVQFLCRVVLAPGHAEQEGVLIERGEVFWILVQYLLVRFFKGIASFLESSSSSVPSNF